MDKEETATLVKLEELVAKQGRVMVIEEKTFDNMAMGTEWDSMKEAFGPLESRSSQDHRHICLVQAIFEAAARVIRRTTSRNVEYVGMTREELYRHMTRLGGIEDKRHLSTAVNALRLPGAMPSQINGVALAPMVVISRARMVDMLVGSRTNELISKEKATRLVTELTNIRNPFIWAAETDPAGMVTCRVIPRKSRLTAEGGRKESQRKEKEAASEPGRFLAKVERTPEQEAALTRPARPAIEGYMGGIMKTDAVIDYMVTAVADKLMADPIFCSKITEPLVTRLMAKLRNI